MCRTLTVVALDMDGNLREDIEEIEFDMEASFEAAGTCTCWIGGDEPEEQALRALFVEQCIKPMLRQVSIGAIKIEVI